AVVEVRVAHRLTEPLLLPAVAGLVASGRGRAAPRGRGGAFPALLMALGGTPGPGRAGLLRRGGRVLAPRPLPRPGAAEPGAHAAPPGARRRPVRGPPGALLTPRRGAALTAGDGPGLAGPGARGARAAAAALLPGVVLHGAAGLAETAAAGTVLRAGAPALTASLTGRGVTPALH